MVLFFRFYINFIVKPDCDYCTSKLSHINYKIFNSLSFLSKKYVEPYTQL